MTPQSSATGRLFLYSNVREFTTVPAVRSKTIYMQHTTFELERSAEVRMRYEVGRTAGEDYPINNVICRPYSSFTLLILWSHSYCLSLPLCLECFNESITPRVHRGVTERLQCRLRYRPSVNKCVKPLAGETLAYPTSDSGLTYIKLCLVEQPRHTD